MFNAQCEVKNETRGFPGDLLVGTPCSLQGVQLQSLVGGNGIPSATAKKVTLEACSLKGNVLLTVPSDSLCSSVFLVPADVDGKWEGLLGDTLGNKCL